jgi:cobalt-precorrin 5A hydrolase
VLNWDQRGLLAIYALTKQGVQKARQLHHAMGGSQLFVPMKFNNNEAGEQSFNRLGVCLGQNFNRFKGHVIFAAAGIVVRAIAPHIKHKAQDPAVVVADHKGHNVISLLSGHLGGANQLTRVVANLIGGNPVITTATDLDQLPSMEMLATHLGMGVENLGALAGVSSSILDGHPVGVWDPGNWLLPELDMWNERFVRLGELPEPGRDRRPVIWVGWKRLDPPKSWLVIRPPCLVAGMGCRKGTELKELEELLRRVLKENDLFQPCLKALATIEAKREEPGLVQLTQRFNLEYIVFENSAPKKVEVPNPSNKVQQLMGVESVCEATALMASQGGELVVEKTKSTNATCAVALISPQAS